MCDGVLRLVICLINSRQGSRKERKKVRRGKMDLIQSYSNPASAPPRVESPNCPHSLPGMAYSCNCRSCGLQDNMRYSTSVFNGTSERGPSFYDRMNSLTAIPGPHVQQPPPRPAPSPDQRET